MHDDKQLVNGESEYPDIKCSIMLNVIKCNLFQSQKAGSDIIFLSAGFICAGKANAQILVRNVSGKLVQSVLCEQL